MRGREAILYRINLVDKILERKEEMQLAALKLKAKKLEPIFNVIRRKLKINNKREATTPLTPKPIKQSPDHHHQPSPNQSELMEMED